MGGDLCNIGASNFALNQFKEAAEAYKTAIKLDDDNADTQYAYGLSLGKLNRTDEEILAYKRTVAIKPDHANALEKLGQGYFKQKRWADAAAAFDQLKIYKPDAKTYNYLGECFFELGKVDDSISALNNAVGYDPDLEQARYNLGRAYIKQGNRDLALVHYEILRNTKSDWADRLFVLLNP
jgi:tetratricopeptide (TPR) repeat protein